MLLFSHQVISNFWPSHGLQYASFPCPSLSLRVCSDSCPLSWWCHPTISLVFLPSIFPSIRVFSNESTLLIRLPKYWSFNFSISPSKEYSELISFRIDWFDLCCPRDSQRVFLAPQLESMKSLVLSFLYGPTLTSVHDHWKEIIILTIQAVFIMRSIGDDLD